MALALVIGACAYESSGVTTTTAGDPNAVPPDTGPADLSFQDQFSEGSSVVIASVSLPSDGFVVLYADEAGEAGDIIGVGERLAAGVIGNVTVPLFVPIEGDTEIHAVVHIDMDRDGVFTYEPPDGFIDVPASFANGEPAAALATIGLLPPLTPADVLIEAQRTLGAEVVVASASLPADGFVVVLADEDGTPGTIVGQTGLLAAGSHDDLVVALDARLEISATLWAEVIIDRDGNGTLTPQGSGGEDLAGLRVDGVEAAASAFITAVPRAPAVIVAADQESEGAEVTLTSITLPSAGFIVVLSDIDGASGETLATGDLLERGTHRDIVLALEPPVEIPGTVWIELHIDLNGDGVLGPEDVIARFEGGEPARLAVALTEPADDDS